jgi:Beta propeller domain
MRSAKWWLLLMIAVLAIIPLVATSCADGNGDDDDDDQSTQKDGLYRCQNCDEVLEWLQQMAALQMERDIDQMYDPDYWGDDDSWGDDDDAVPGDDTWDDDDDAAGDDDSAPIGDDDDFSDDDASDDDAAPPTDDDENTGGDDDDDGDYTDTNVQEEGVDEADIVKTDGEYLYVVAGGYLIIFDSDPEAATEERSRVDIEGYATDMYLYADKALVFSRLYRSALLDSVWPEVDRDEINNTITKLTVIDHSDKTDPFVIRELYLEGDLISSRMIAGDVRVVSSLRKPLPSMEYYIDPGQYNSPEELAAAIEDLKAQNRTIIEATTLEDWLGRFFSIEGEQTEAGLISECPDHYRPLEPMGSTILSVVTVRMSDPTARQQDISVMADGYIVYASQANLYVAGSADATWEWSEDEDFADEAPIHRFDIASDSEEVLYLGSGMVQGWMLNQFSLSEYDGHLRAATTYGGWRTGTPERNGVFVLALDDEEGLAPAGSLENLALDESIYAARMIGPRGYLVTFRQTDPLFTIDLSDPTNPTMVGELAIPGFSTYLHPMGQDHLLAIGEGGDEWGSDGTLALSIFDVSDFANPQKLWGHNFGWASSDAAYDHHAFLYDGSRDMLAIPLMDYGYWDDDDDTWSDDDDSWDDDDDDSWADDDEPVKGEGEFAGVVVLNATAADGFAELTRIDHADMEPETGSEDFYGLPTPRRSVRIGDYLFTISDVGLIVTGMSDWVNDVEISLPYEQEEYDYGDDDMPDDGWVDDDDDVSDGDDEPGVGPEDPGK